MAGTGRWRGTILVAIAMAAFAGHAQVASSKDGDAKESAGAKPAGQTGAWVVRQPYKDNPLKEAVLGGVAEHDSWQGKAELELNCRPGNGVVYVEMHANVTGSGFDVDPFEGPGGAGEKSKGLKVELGGQSWMQSFSGFYIENDVFVFSSAMAGDEARALVADATGGQALVLEISAAGEKGTALKGKFMLPREAKAVRAAMAPCMEEKK